MIYDRCDATDGQCICHREEGHAGQHLCRCDRRWSSQSAGWRSGVEAEDDQDRSAS